MKHIAMTRTEVCGQCECQVQVHKYEVVLMVGEYLIVCHDKILHVHAHVNVTFVKTQDLIFTHRDLILFVFPKQYKLNLGGKTPYSLVNYASRAPDNAIFRWHSFVGTSMSSNQLTDILVWLDIKQKVQIMQI